MKVAAASCVDSALENRWNVEGNKEVIADTSECRSVLREGARGPESEREAVRCFERESSARGVRAAGGAAGARRRRAAQLCCCRLAKLRTAKYNIAKLSKVNWVWRLSTLNRLADERHTP